ncbi:type VII secretion-associated serine protease mycosin [Micromonospora sp. NPDC003197]
MARSRQLARSAGSLAMLVTGVTVLVACVVAVVTGTAGPAVAAGCSGNVPASGDIAANLPPEQLMLGAGRVWPSTAGQGVTVAVVDTGVDGSHPQLYGAVKQGWDLVTATPGGTLDCTSHGTAVASVIAARPLSGIGFVGVAPGASILPIRVTEGSAGSERDISASLAQAIRWATDHGAQVINLSLVTGDDSAALRAAVTYAQDRDVLLVAAAGTRSDEANADEDPPRPDPPSYPAAYPGVLGVGAVDDRGVRLRNSPIGPQVDLVAPGGNVLAATRVRGHAYWSGTGIAAPAVSAAAALVRAAHPGLSAVEVQRRLLATANRGPGGSDSAGYGRGLLDPYRAVTDSVAGGAAIVLPGMAARADDTARRESDRRWNSLARTAVVIAAVSLGGAMLVTIVGALRRRRRPDDGWTLASGDPADPTDSLDAPEAYFAIPKPPHPN